MRAMRLWLSHSSFVDKSDQATVGSISALDQSDVLCITKEVHILLVNNMARVCHLQRRLSSSDAV